MAKIPSIALIPSGYKSTKIYSVLPVDGNADFTFDRGTSTDQTRVNKDGLIESVAQDVPRLDYLDGGCPSLLLEPATTNLITYSEDFSNVAWVKSNTTINANNSLSPDGSLNADELVVTSASLGDAYFNASVADDSNTYIGSVYVKKSTTDKFSYIYLRFLGGTTGIIYGINLNQKDGTFVDIDDTAFSGASLPSSVIGVDDFSDNYWRVYFGGANNSTGNTSLRIYFNPERGTSFGDFTLVNGGITIYGAQLEQQSYATSYVPSLAGVSGVRAAETCNGSGTTAEINSQEGVLYAEIRALANDGTIRRIALSNGTTNNVVRLEYSSTDNRLFGVLFNGSNQGTIFTDDFTATDYIKVAYKYSVNDFALYVNGLLINNVTSGTTFSSNTLNQLAFDNGGGGNDFYGRVKRLSVYDSALTENELEALTGFGSFSEMAQYLNYA